MRMRSLWAISTPAALATVFLMTAPATPYAQETTENQFTTTLDVRMGERLFRQQCSRCHGRDGDGGELGPALTNGFSSASTDAGLFRIVREGIPNTQMIGISRTATEQSVWMVVSYLNSMNDTGAADLPGDAAAGRQVFAGKGNCSSCHMVNGEGGRRGPDLSRSAAAAMRTSWPATCARRTRTSRRAGGRCGSPARTARWSRACA